MHGNYFYDDLDDILENVNTSEVTSIFFPYLRKSIIIDLRSNDDDGPAIILTDMVNNPQERIRSLKHLRPNFPEVEKMIIVCAWLENKLISFGERLEAAFDRLVNKAIK